MYKGEEGGYPDFSDKVVCTGDSKLSSACGVCAKCLFEESLVKCMPVEDKSIDELYNDLRKSIHKLEQDLADSMGQGLDDLGGCVPMQTGWVCPRCGGVNSPSTSRCPCVPLPPIQWTC